jgi:hypothetical protein
MHLLWVAGSGWSCGGLTGCVRDMLLASVRPAGLAGIRLGRELGFSLILAALLGNALSTRCLVRSELATVALLDHRLHLLAAGGDVTSPQRRGCRHRRSRDQRPVSPGPWRVALSGSVCGNPGLAPGLAVCERARRDHAQSGSAARFWRFCWRRSASARDLAVWRLAVRSVFSRWRAFWASSVACRCVATRASHSALA